jgi:hypothetical protein
LAKSDASEFNRRLSITSIGDIMRKFEKELLMQERIPTIQQAFLPCFAGKVQQTSDFVTLLNRVAWEKYHAHSQVINSLIAFHSYKAKILANPLLLKQKPASANLVDVGLPKEITIIGGDFPLTRDQIATLFNRVIHSNDWHVSVTYPICLSVDHFS